MKLLPFNHFWLLSWQFHAGQAIAEPICLDLAGKGVNIRQIPWLWLWRRKSNWFCLESKGCFSALGVGDTVKSQSSGQSGRHRWLNSIHTHQEVSQGIALSLWASLDREGETPVAHQLSGRNLFTPWCPDLHSAAADQGWGAGAGQLVPFVSSFGGYSPHINT